MEKSGFPEQTTEEINEVFISYGLGSGIPREVMTSLLSPKHVADAAEGIIKETFAVGAGYSFEGYSSDIYQILYAFAQSEGIEITEDVETGLRDLADLCADSLRNHLSTPVFEILSRFRQYTGTLFAVTTVFLILTIITLIIIPYVNRRVTRWIDGYIYALGAALVICIGIPAAYYISEISSRLMITPQSYNKLLSSWLDGIINGYIVALIPISFALLFFIIIRTVRKKNRYRAKGRRYSQAANI